MESEPYSIAAAIAAALAGGFSAWSHYFSKRKNGEVNSSIRPQAKHLEQRVDELSEKVEALQDQLIGLQRSVGRLEGRSSSTGE